jgi:hypothetical protein
MTDAQQAKTSQTWIGEGSTSSTHSHTLIPHGLHDFSRRRRLGQSLGMTYNSFRRLEMHMFGARG